MNPEFQPALRVLFVGVPDTERARLDALLGPRDPLLRCDVCASGEVALATARREPIDALLLGPFSEVDQIPTRFIGQLSQCEHPPAFLLLGAPAWSSLAWHALPLTGVDDVLAWDSWGGARLRQLLAYRITRAQSAGRSRAARTRSEVLTAAVTGLAEARGCAALCTTALEAAIALHASGCAVLLCEGDDLVLADARGLADAERALLARGVVGLAAHPVVEAARTRRAHWSSGDEACTGALPLLIADQPAGVLWVRLSRADADAIEALQALARHFAEALAREARSTRQSERMRHAEQLITITAHDLRSPLQVISMGASLLRLYEAVLPSHRFLTERIIQSADRASAMVEELLALATSRQRSDEAGAETTCAFALLRACVQDFQLRMPHCPIALSTRGTGEAVIDSDHLTRVLHNLVGNAAHYREPGSTVEVRGIGAAEQVYLEVQNRGPALTDVQLADLFAPMKRGTRGGEPGSVGLGLYIVKTLVEDGGGRVWARSSVDDGTTFVVALPRWPRRSEIVRVVYPHGAPSAPPASYAVLLEALPKGPLVRLLGAWLELGGASLLPHPRQLDRTRLIANLPDMFWVDVLCDLEGRAQFALLEMGGVLERRLDGYAPDELLQRAASHPLEPSMRAAYERCARTHRPAFDYMRSRGRGGTFSRLVLPFSRDGEQVTQLIGMALFDGLDEATHARASAQGVLPLPPALRRAARKEDPA